MWMDRRKNSFERRVYEWVDEKSLYKVMSRKPTENRTREPKGDVWIIIYMYILCTNILIIIIMLIMLYMHYITIIIYFITILI